MTEKGWRVSLYLGPELALSQSTFPVCIAVGSYFYNIFNKGEDFDYQNIIFPVLWGIPYNNLENL